MRETDWLFVAGLALFVAGTAVVVMGIAWSSDGLALVGVAGLAGAAVTFAVGAWRLRSRADWQRIEAEQRLWESGPLGRAWLRIRQLLGSGPSRP